MRASLVLLVLLLLMVTAVIGALVDFSAKGNDVINRWEPAYSLSESLLADVVNQETGVRGYALGHRDSFLQPYRDYLAAEVRHEKALSRLISGRGDLQTAFTEFRTATRAWRSSIATPFIARVRAHDPSVGEAASSDRAKAAFDRIRVAASALTAKIGAVRDQAKRDRVTSIRIVVAAFIVSALLVLLAGVVVWRALRRTVLGPVEDLARQAREVAGGAIDKRIVATGPAEIAELGRDVDTMREQIASELARVEAARAVLAERGEDLARSNADLEQFAYV
ncbi:MAG TPA: CHASE3 domain-containing protein, partial [Jatrophihabitans sp.]|uniref:CHASE3 domain-containing protein n=1 Tax=Jatrophihabitans sp. TaxID=1932789 RepID=UPI002DF92F97|nr:CHASE3 domain-containing protein [Jatrophihabitans sp.]